MATITDDPSPSASQSDDEQNDDGNIESKVCLENACASATQSLAGQSLSSKAGGSPRPKRKKARRACFACQRAHLTCGDERPCLRCIKRGLHNACQDGMRKKAKYLHDTPDVAVKSCTDNSFGTIVDVEKPSSGASAIALDADEGLPQHTQHQRVPSKTYQAIAETSNQPQMPPSSSEVFDYCRYPGQERSILPAFNAHQHSSNESTGPASHHGPRPASSLVQPYGEKFFDVTDPSGINFDLSSMNFGNHYGALEFGMLRHMSSAVVADQMQAVQYMPTDAIPATNQNLHAGYVDNSTHDSIYSFDQDDSKEDWQAENSNHTLSSPSYDAEISTFNQPLRGGSYYGPDAFAIGISSANPQKASSSPHVLDMGTSFPNRWTGSATRNNLQEPRLHSKTFSLPKQTSPYLKPRIGPKSEHALPQKLDQLPLAPTRIRTRRRDPSKIYSSVTQAYPYTSGFHALTAVLQRRFSSQKRLVIAQALASIRPSFISCTKALVSDDLIFMEKCFQRSLLEYEEFVEATGTPTIICRRTGEVAHAGKEFSLLTGWSWDVLVGRAPNLNINTQSGSGGTSGTVTANSLRSGINTPRVPADRIKPESEVSQPSRPQPVFLVELLDDDSVIQFYEDFAKLAFADSKGSVWSPCKLLKYRTQEELVLGSFVKDSETRTGKRVSTDADTFSTHSRRDQTAEMPSEETHPQTHRVADPQSSYKTDGCQEVPSISAEREMSRLGNKEGKVDCMYCWTVRRDVFDIPMAIVINFLPILPE